MFSDFDIKETIYSGKLTKTYRVISKKNNQSYILKALFSSYPKPEEIALLIHEHSFAKNINISGIIHSFELIREEKKVGLLLEDIGGIPLSEYLNGKVLDNNTFFSIAIPVVNALESLHNLSIIHKDIKPQNIILKPDLTDVRLTDLGIASNLEQENQVLVKPEFLQGTLLYMSPEQTGRMNRPLDFKTDLYSLGVTFFEMVTGKLPFNGDDPLEIVHAHIARRPPLSNEINPLVPPLIVEIIDKLLSKNSEDRYSSSASLRRDLEKIKEPIQKNTKIQFSLDHHKKNGAFYIPRKLYGRKKHIDLLFKYLNDVCQGMTRFVWVSGYSGIGKSAIIGELHVPAMTSNAYFIQGKFDQFNHNYPYSGFIQAFTDLISQLLSGEESEIQFYRNKILNNCESDNHILLNFIPLMEKVIGEQTRSVDIAAIKNSKDHISDTILCLMKIFADKSHPLIIFLDDMQWADQSSLNLILKAGNDPELNYFMFAGAYRDNETGSEHPLSFMMKDLERNGINIKKIHTGPLSQDEVKDLVMDTLNDQSLKIRDLAKIVHRKTGGNPFFIRQLLNNLYHEGILTFKEEKGHWNYSYEKVETLEYSSNVIDLMVHRINKMNLNSIHVLKVASCIGDSFDLNVLSLILQKNINSIYADLWVSMKEGFIYSTDKRVTNEKNKEEISKIKSKEVITLKYNYRFIHDRIRQAAYSMLDEKEKPIMHLKIGNLLLAGMKDPEEEIFQITEHLNKGIHLLNDTFSRKQILKMNMRAGNKAMQASAFSVALGFFQAGASLFNDELWETDFDLAYSLFLSIGEAWYLNGNFEKAEEVFQILVEKSRNNIDLIEIYNLKIILYANRGDYSESSNAAIEIINQFGYSISLKNLRVQIFQEYKKAKKLQRSKDALEFLNHKKMQNIDYKKIMKVFVNVTSSAFFWNPEFSTLISLLMVNMTFEHGNTTGSDYAYCMYGITLAGMGDYRNAYEFGKLGQKLNEQTNDIKTKIKITNAFYGWLNHWKNNVSTSIPMQQQGFQSAMHQGQLLFGGFIATSIVMNYDSSGTTLSAYYNDTFRYQKFVNKIKYTDAELCILLLRQKAEVLKGSTYSLDSLNSDTFNEEIFEEMASQSNNRLPLFLYYSVKSRILYMNQNYLEAYRMSIQATKISTSSSGMMPMVEHLFFHALILSELLFSYTSRNDFQKEQKNNPSLSFTSIQKEINRIIKKFTDWANYSNDNFQHKLCLIKAEYFRALLNFKEAAYFYDCSIESAIESGFIQHAALASERAFYFYMEQELKRAGTGYLKEAYYWYQIWHAHGKSEDLKTRFSDFLSEVIVEKNHYGNTASITSETSPGFHLDFNTIIKATRAISGKMEINDLISSLLTISVENAGAEKGVLLLEYNSRYRVEKVLLIKDNKIESPDEEYYEAGLWASPAVISYVLRSKEKVVLDDALSENRFARDKYIQKNHPRSLLCMPIIHHNNVTGILYLENNLTTGAFTSDRTEILDLIGAQAAISIANAKLYAHKELEYAQKIQKSILPEVCNNPFFDIACSSHPAEAVGGDYYDYIHYGDRYFFFIGDVSGHGLTAGLLSMMVQTSLHTILQMNPNIDQKELIKSLDRIITFNLKKMGIFKYMTYLLLSTKDGKEIEYSGLHNETLLYRQETGEIEIFESQGKWLGIEIEMDSSLKQILEMKSGDVLLLYTDGITEAFDLRGNEYGLERLKKILEKYNNLSAAEIRDKILNDVFSFMHYQKDDITMIIIKKL